MFCMRLGTTALETFNPCSEGTLAHPRMQPVTSSTDAIRLQGDAARAQPAKSFKANSPASMHFHGPVLSQPATCAAVCCRSHGIRSNPQDLR